MPASVTSSQVYTFADGGAGHACVFAAGAPAVGEFDVLFVNSDTTVSTPAGFTLQLSNIGNQGGYTFTRQAVGGETNTVTITTSGNFNTGVSWSRIHGANIIDAAGVVQAHAESNDVTTPAVSTGALASATDLVLVGALLHAVPGAGSSPVNPVWSAGYNPVTSLDFGTNGTSIHQFVGVKVPAGAAAESPNVTWTNLVRDRYIQVVSFTSQADQTVLPNSVTATTTLGAPAVSWSGAVNPDPVVAVVSLGAPTVSGPANPLGLDLVPLLARFLLQCLCTTANRATNPPKNCCLRVGADVPMDADLYTDLCCEGLAYVSLGDVFPSTSSFPDQDIIRQAQARCGIASWAVSLRAGIIRCAPTGTETTMPTCTDWTASAVQNFTDAQVLRVASCCFLAGFQNLNDQLLGMSVVINRQNQSSPNGGCLERYVTFDVQIPNCDC